MYENEYGNNGYHASHPAQFEGGIHVKMAETLFHAINMLDNGLFPEETERLTGRLVDLFADVSESRPGIKKIGSLAYHAAGIISDERENDYRDIPVPPFEPAPVESDETEERAAMLRREYQGKPGNLMLRQLLWAMTGKPAVRKRHAIGRVLPKIEKLVSKVEQLMDENPDIDVLPMLGGLLDRIGTETDAAFACSMADCYDYEWPGGSGKLVYSIKYADDDAVRETAKAMSKGTLTPERIEALTDSLLRYAHTVRFVPAESVTDMLGHGFSDELTRIRREHKTYLERTYIDAMAQSIMFTSRALYDAIQEYAMYDSVTDKDVRRFFTASGLLAKDWRPDPDLWLRAARLIPANFDKSDIAWSSYANNLLLTPEIHDGAIKVAARCADGVLEHLADSISSDIVKDKLRQISKGENQK